MDLLETAAELYAMPPGEFTAARDAAARELAGAPEAARVKALRKPSAAAWVVGLLVRLETGEIDQLLEVGAALRAAQHELDAGQLRALTAQRRQLTAALTSRARALAQERSVAVSNPVADQVEQTLTAAMLDEGAAAAVRSGLLVTALSANGVDPVDATAAVALPEALDQAAAPASRELRSVARPDADDDAEAEERTARRRQARRELTTARQAARAAATAHDRADRRLQDQHSRREETQRQLAELRDRIATVEESARRAEDDLAAVEREERQAAAEAVRTDEALTRVEQAWAELDD
jgi:hypothetical protein